MVRQARVKRKLKPGMGPLDAWEFREFIKKLDLINKQSALIARLLWKLNRLLARSGSYVTLEQILLLECSAIHEDKKMFDLTRRSSGRLVWVAIELPNSLFNQIISNIKPNSQFVFSNKDGNPLFPKQITEHFQEAGKQTTIRSWVKGFLISPGLLRPIYNPSSRVAVAYQKKCDKQPCRAITDGQLEKLLTLLPERCRGVKPKYALMDTLKAIVYRIQTQCKWDNLQPGSPPWKAVESQFRRWKKSGFIKEVQDFLAEHASKPCDQFDE